MFMKNRLYLSVCLWIFFFVAPLAAEDFRTIMWDDLLPEGEIELLEKMLLENGGAVPLGHSFDADLPTAPEQFGTFNVVKELQDQKVRLPGYILPVEYDAAGDVLEFLFVPYKGACIHMPPPPPNQIVYVSTEDPENYGPLWRPVWVFGTMKTERHMNMLGNTAYSLELEGWEPYAN